MMQFGTPSGFIKNVVINHKNLPFSQKLSCYNSDTYKFERKRLGKIMAPTENSQYGKYLYRNLRNGVLIASHDPPSNKNIYSSSDIGMDIGDALPYYKNE
jgi:hypothetical protein